MTVPGTPSLVDPYDTVLVDLDGVVYRGARGIPHAADVLAELRRRHIRASFVTNNASRTPDAVAAQLTSLGIPAAASDVITSAQAAARVVAGLVPTGAAVLVVGGAGLEAALIEYGLRPVRTLAESPDAVVQGYAPEVDWRQLAEASYAVAQGVPWVAANADMTLPTDQGLAPGNGALVAAVSAATGTSPVVAGKPEPPLHREAMIRTGAAKPLVVGDRLDTDIEGANRAGADSLLVLTGVTTAMMLVNAGPNQRPTHIGADLRALLAPANSVEVADGTASCGGWTVRVDSPEIKVLGDGDPIDRLRAVSMAVWSSSALVPPGVVAEVVGALGVPSGSPEPGPPIG